MLPVVIAHWYAIAVGTSGVHQLHVPGYDAAFVRLVLLWCDW